MKFKEFVKDIEEKKWNVHGVEVYENGELIHSYGDTRDNIYDIYSATKSVLSIVFGIVYDRGLIDLQKSVLEYLPKEKVSAMTQKQKDTFSSITIQRLLTMAVPDYPLRPEGDNYLDYSLEYEIHNPEKVVFNYSKQWVEDFSKKQLPEIYSLLEKYRDKEIVVFRSREDADVFISLL